MIIKEKFPAQPASEIVVSTLSLASKSSRRQLREKNAPISSHMKMTQDAKLPDRSIEESINSDLKSITSLDYSNPSSHGSIGTDDIDTENKRYVLSLSESEVKQELSDLESRFSPEVLQFLKVRCFNKKFENSVLTSQSVDNDIIMSQQQVMTNVMPVPAKPLTVANNPPSGKDKQSKRYDMHGRLIVNQASIEYPGVLDQLTSKNFKLSPPTNHLLITQLSELIHNFLVSSQLIHDVKKSGDEIQGDGMEPSLEREYLLWDDQGLTVSQIVNMMRSDAELQRVLSLQAISDIFLSRDLILALPVYAHTYTTLTSTSKYHHVYSSFADLVTSIRSLEALVCDDISMTVTSIIIEIYSTELPVSIPTTLYSNMAAAKSSITYTIAVLKTIDVYLFNFIDDDVVAMPTTTSTIKPLVGFPPYHTPHIARPSSKSYEAHAAECRKEYMILSETMRESQQGKYSNNNLSDDFALLCRWSAVDAFLQHTNMIDIILKMHASSCMIISSSTDVKVLTSQLQISCRIMKIVNSMIMASFCSMDVITEGIASHQMLDLIVQTWRRLDTVDIMGQDALLLDTWVKRWRNQTIVLMETLISVEIIIEHHHYQVRDILTHGMTCTCSDMMDKMVQLRCIRMIGMNNCLDESIFSTAIGILSSVDLRSMVDRIIHESESIYWKEYMMTTQHLFTIACIFINIDESSNSSSLNYLSKIILIIDSIVDVVCQMDWQRLLDPSSSCKQSAIPATLACIVAVLATISMTSNTNSILGYIFIQQPCLHDESYKTLFRSIHDKISHFINSVYMMGISSRMLESISSHCTSKDFDAAMIMADIYFNLLRLLYLHVASFDPNDDHILIGCQAQLHIISSLLVYPVSAGIHASILSRIMQETSFFLLALVYQYNRNECCILAYRLLDAISSGSHDAQPSYVHSILRIAFDSLLELLPNYKTGFIYDDMRNLMDDITVAFLPESVPDRSTLLYSIRQGNLINLTSIDSTVSSVAIGSDILYRAWSMISSPQQLSRWLILLIAIESSAVIDDAVSVYNKISYVLQAMTSHHASIWQLVSQESDSSQIDVNVVEINRNLASMGCALIGLLLPKLLSLGSECMYVRNIEIPRAQQKALAIAIGKSSDLVSASHPTSILSQPSKQPRHVDPHDEQVTLLVAQLIEASIFSSIDSHLHAAALSVIISPFFPWRTRERVWRELGEIQLLHIMEDYPYGVVLNILHLVAIPCIIYDENSSALARSIAKALIRLRSIEERNSMIVLLGLLNIAQYLFDGTSEVPANIIGMRARLLLDLADTHGEFFVANDDHRSMRSSWLLEGVVHAFMWSKRYGITTSNSISSENISAAVASSWLESKQSEISIDATIHSNDGIIQLRDMMTRTFE